MGLFGNDTLKFDVASFRTMSDKIQETITELEEKNQSMLEAFEQIKEKWNTPAGRSYMQKINLDWLDDVEKYAVLLNAVKELLNEAATEYEALEDKAAALSF